MDTPNESRLKTQRGCFGILAVFLFCVVLSIFGEEREYLARAKEVSDLKNKIVGLERQNDALKNDLVRYAARIGQLEASRDAKRAVSGF